MHIFTCKFPTLSGFVTLMNIKCSAIQLKTSLSAFEVQIRVLILEKHKKPK
jgi:hypothetical protein